MELHIPISTQLITNIVIQASSNNINLQTKVEHFRSNSQKNATPFWVC